MASSTTMQAAIYMCTNEGDTEETLADSQSIGMDYGIKDTSMIAIDVYEWDEPSRQTDVPNPSNQSLSKPNTGMANITLTIGIKFNENNISGQNNYLGTLALWGLLPKTVKTLFPYGRFGVRCNDKPWMNYQPDTTAGWQISDVNTNPQIQYGGRVDVTVTLIFGGSVPSLIAAIETLLGDGLTRTTLSNSVKIKAAPIKKLLDKLKGISNEEK
jgi:hypothetical protein